MSEIGDIPVVAVPGALAAQADGVADILNDRFEFRSIELTQWVHRWKWLARSASSFTPAVNDPDDAYVTGLFARVWLAEAMTAAEPELSWWLVREVDVIDELFRANTVLDLEDLLWGETRNPQWWWLRRLPRDVELAAAIRRNSEWRKSELAINVVQSASTFLGSGEPVEIYQIDDDVWVRVASADRRMLVWFKSERPARTSGLLDDLLGSVAVAASLDGPFLHESLSIKDWSFWRGNPAPISAFARNPMRKSRLPAAIALDVLKETFTPIRTADTHGL